jgi:hypothetical protein
MSLMIRRIDVPSSTTSLTLIHLRFTCEALTAIDLAGFRAGGQLRGALGNVMRRAYCPEAHSDRAPAPEHVALCPVCWLLVANEHPGEERRGYAIVPPLTGPSGGLFAPTERFTFGLTLFGDTLRLMPYFLLAIAEVGHEGVGIGRGKFVLRQVWSVDPLNDRSECVLAEGETVVHSPAMRIDDATVRAAADRLENSVGSANRIRLRFLTPMRLIANEQLIKAPDFGVLFARLLERIDQLDRQYSNGARRDEIERETLLGLANQVRLAESQTEWVEVRSGSSRRGDSTWISGFVGAADFIAPRGGWHALLHWLMWGQLTQVGKDVVKGNGVYELITR